MYGQEACNEQIPHAAAVLQPSCMGGGGWTRALPHSTNYIIQIFEYTLIKQSSTKHFNRAVTEHQSINCDHFQVPHH